jgi:hypothetical protein
MLADITIVHSVYGSRVTVASHNETAFFFHDDRAVRALPVRRISNVNLSSHEESCGVGHAPIFAFVLGLPLAQGRTAVKM